MAVFTTNSKMMTVISIVASYTTTSSQDLAYFAAQAENEVMARLAKLYTLPLSNVPILETIVTEIAVQKYLEQRVFTSERRNDSEWPKRFNRAWETLSLISTGQISLVDSAQAIIAARTDQSDVWSSNEDYLPTFTEDDPVYHIVDADKIDDLRDDRNQ